MKYPIGTKFFSRGKSQNLCTVVDVLRTYNSAEDLVRVRYVCTHEFMGQTVTDYDVPETSITMALAQNGEVPANT